ncbi:uncharacterized protein N7459_002857 [Penicillium hispanicum]|uniref:uncharacterized protein n=1 Tax=Penicillium hispanicum TaxID=1080232 RepID=UPI002540569E|nr:uncharacterized protein N7459_002857 [Penicillium hispanicum]KAJ5587092.1 hypothetical protein N7459_002857 [Penicillium hispanicum]
MSITLLLSIFFAVFALAIPAHLRAGLIAKRDQPQIINGYNEDEITQLHDAFDDAMTLARTMQTTPAEILDPIFQKYFALSDKATVLQVFENITGSDQNFDNGNPLLGHIRIVEDYLEDGDQVCEGDDDWGELRLWETDYPNMVVCPPAFGHGGINKGYDGVAAVTCASIGNSMSWRMETLGSFEIHEFTHFEKLVVPPLPEETSDDYYGILGARKAGRDGKCLEVADCFMWVAIEVYWTVNCARTFADPAPDADTDPIGC